MPSSTYHFENKLQAKISPSEKILEKPQEELNPFKKHLGEFHTGIKYMSGDIDDMLAKINDTLTN